MDEDDGRNMASLYENNGELLASLVMFAPPGNVRVALVQLIDFLTDLEDGAEIDVRVVLEIVTRGVIQLGFASEEDCEHPDHQHDQEFERRGFEDLSELSPEETLAHFRRQLGIDGDDKKEEN